MITEWWHQAVFKLHVFRIERKLSLPRGRLAEALNALVKQSGKQISVVKYVKFGGVNNEGMFVGCSEGNFVSELLIKLQTTEFANREVTFMDWQKENGLYLSPESFGKYTFDGINLTAVCSEFLQTPLHYDAGKVHELYRKIIDASSLRSGLLTDEYLESSVIPDTPIKKVLRGVVTKRPGDDISVWLEGFLSERKSLINDDQLYCEISDFFRNVSSAWSQLAVDRSLVHGDFKRQNILSDTSGGYRVIDLQYYTVGQPLWDLAFYYSKYQSGFSAAFDDFKAHEPDGEETLFLFFYLVAVLINIKPRKWEVVKEMKVRPVLDKVGVSIGSTG